MRIVSWPESLFAHQTTLGVASSSLVREGQMYLPSWITFEGPYALLDRSQGSVRSESALADLPEGGLPRAGSLRQQCGMSSSSQCSFTWLHQSKPGRHTPPRSWALQASIKRTAFGKKLLQYTDTHSRPRGLQVATRACCRSQHIESYQNGLPSHSADVSRFQWFCIQCLHYLGMLTWQIDKVLCVCSRGRASTFCI